MGDPMREQAAVLALVQASVGEWYQTADMISEAGSAVRLLDREPLVLSAQRRQRADEVVSLVRPASLDRARLSSSGWPHRTCG
jgi:hypothetical protein